MTRFSQMLAVVQDSSAIRVVLGRIAKVLLLDLIFYDIYLSSHAADQSGLLTQRRVRIGLRSAQGEK